MSLLYKIWYWIRWPLAVLVIFYIVVLLYSTLIGGGVFLFTSNPINHSTSPTSDGNPTQTTSVPSDWVSYTNSEWGISFKYPSTWKLSETKRTQEEYDTLGHAVPVEGLVSINIQGDEYYFKIDKGGSDLPDKTYTHPQYEIDGLNANTVEDDSGAGFTIFLSVYISKDRGGFRFIIASDSSKSKILTDQILSTITF